MKARFVLCHPASSIEGEARQVFLSDCLRQEGHDSAVFTFSPSRKPAVAPYLGSQSLVHYFVSDEPESPPHRTTSKALLEALRADEPDMILVKGVDYSLSHEIFASFPPHRIAVIIGGTAQHRLLDKCGLIYFETPRQRAAYLGPAKTCILPKYIRWEELDDGADGAQEVEFDIVNVGNFNEPRKAQEFLLPFLLNYRVVFVGDGTRRPAIAQLCAGNKNVTFAGYVPQAKTYSFIRRSRLMVHCATWDGYPRVVADSLACGVPVVGLAGVLDGVVEGEFLQCTPIQDLYAQVFKLLQAPEDLAQLGRKAAEYMRSISGYEAVKRSFLGGLALVLKNQ